MELHRRNDMAGEMRCGVGAANQKYYRLYYTLLLKFQCSGTNMSSKEESCWEGKSRCESDDQDKFFERISLKLFPYTSKIGFALRKGFPLTRNSLFSVSLYAIHILHISLSLTTVSRMHSTLHPSSSNQGVWNQKSLVNSNPVHLIP